MVSYSKKIFVGMLFVSCVGKSSASFRVPEKVEHRSEVTATALSIGTGAVAAVLSAALAAVAHDEVIPAALAGGLIVTGASYLPYYYFVAKPYWLKWTALARYNIEKVKVEKIGRKLRASFQSPPADVLDGMKCKLETSQKNLEVVIYEMQNRCSDRSVSSREQGVSNVALYDKCETLRTHIGDLLETINFMQSSENETVLVDASIQTDDFEFFA